MVYMNIHEMTTEDIQQYLSERLVLRDKIEHKLKPFLDKCTELKKVQKNISTTITFSIFNRSIKFSSVSYGGYFTWKVPEIEEELARVKKEFDALLLELDKCCEENNIDKNVAYIYVTGDTLCQE